MDIREGDDKTHIKRRLQMQQMSFESDLKKLVREKENIEIEKKRSAAQLTKIQSMIESYKTKERRLDDKETFLKQSLEEIKKKLINLRH